MARLPDTIQTYVKKPSSDKRKKKINKQYPQLVDQQWTTAYVKKVIINSDHPEAGGDESMVNAIIAIKHGDNLEANYGGDIAGSVYYPLLRGIADVPAKGDQVLVCRFAGNYYYLGPLNINNKPCINEDNRFDEIVDSGYNPYNYSDDEEDYTYTDYSETFAENGLNPFFPAYCPKRVQKPYIHKGEDDKGAAIDLDGVGHTLTLGQMKESEDINKAMIREVPGDLILEGRFGNSLRLGSRYKYPVLTLTNRGEDIPGTDYYDKTVGGSILAMIQRGSIHDNFELGPGATNSRSSNYIFQTSNDIRVNGLISEGQNAEYGFGDKLYDYTYGGERFPGGQALFRSGRVTIDSSEDNIFLSALKGIIVGAGEKVVVRANQTIHLEAESFFLGGNHKETYDDTPVTADKYKDANFEPMIFGDTLVQALKDFLVGMKSMKIATQIGPQDVNKILTSDLTLGQTIKNLEQKLDEVLSERHFIEKPSS